MNNLKESDMAEVDKEMTILAAKAAGIEHPGGDHSKHDDGRLWDCKRLRWWNPLHDDGDAYRLAVAMNLQVSAGTFHDGMDTALRRAIVRAAAEIAPTQEKNT